MRSAWRAILCAAIAALVCYDTMLADVVESRELSNLSVNAAAKFLEDVRAAESNKASFEFSFEVSSTCDKNLKKFGTLSYDNSNDIRYKIVFDDEEFELYGSILSVKGVECQKRLYEQFLNGFVLCPIDLKFVFAGADEYFYVGPARVAGRSVQQFACEKSISINGSQISYTKLSIDEKFKSVLQVDFLKADKKPARRISVMSFKEFDGIWFPKAIKFLDFDNNQRSKLEITSLKVVK